MANYIFYHLVYSKPSIKKLQIHNVITDIGPKWYQLGIALLDDEHMSQLKIIRKDNDDEISRCTDLFIYWLQSHSNPTWYQLIQALRSNGVNLESVASMLGRIFHGLLIVHTYYNTYYNA